jgi:outer membrane biosynthesis protein TonB
VFLDRLESGFLLFQTRQGLVRVELSFWQRIYLLWTFRNFRRLSTPLLNSRQRALVNALFHNNDGAVLHSYDPLLVIGVVENYTPLTVRTGASPVQKKEQQEKLVAPREEITPRSRPVPSSARGVAWSRLATTLSVLSLCIISVAAWHRMQGIPGSQALNRPRLQRINAIERPNSRRPENPTSIAVYPTAVVQSTDAAPPLAVPKDAIQPTAIAPVIRAANQGIHIRSAVPSPNLALSGQNSGFQASRPPLHFAYPVYAEVRTRGVVALTALVDCDGTVRAVRVVSGNRALAGPAVRAVRQWRYRPYLKDGQPVATETNIVISVISDDAISMTFPPTMPASQLAETEQTKHGLSEKLKMR